MKKPLLAIAAASLAAIVPAAGALSLATDPATTPAPATTFPSLTTIYVASGVFDDGSGANVGRATSVHCSNVSGQSAEVRVLVLSAGGNVAGASTQTVPHGGTQTFSTHGTLFSDALLGTGPVLQGVVNVESTQSGVFCSAMLVSAAFPENGVALHMVRINGHPGAIE